MRFDVTTNEIGEIVVYDTKAKRYYRYDSMSDFLGLIRILNELDKKVNE